MVRKYANGVNNVIKYLELTTVKMAFLWVESKVGPTYLCENPRETSKMFVKGWSIHNNIVKIAKTNVPFEHSKCSVHHLLKCCGNIALTEAPYSKSIEVTSCDKSCHFTALIAKGNPPVDR